MRLSIAFSSILLIIACSSDAKRPRTKRQAFMARHFRESVLNSINADRSISDGYNKLELSHDLNREAQACAEMLAERDSIEFTGNYGDRHTKGWIFKWFSVRDGADDENELNDSNVSNHYTKNVWKRARKLGLGIEQSEQTGRMYSCMTFEMETEKTTVDDQSSTTPSSSPINGFSIGADANI